MFRFERRIHFGEVDSARVVFFARFGDYCHEALEALFDALPGGYADLTSRRDLGIPTVRIDMSFESALRYGDVMVIDVEVTRLGTKSVQFRHTFRRKRDEKVCATVHQTVVLTKLSAFIGVPIPDDIRTLLSRHQG